MAKETKRNISKAKDYVEKQAVNQPKEQMQRKAADSIRRTAGNIPKSIKTVEHSGKTIKQTARSTGRATVKTAQKSIKTAEHTAKTAIKTTQQVAKTAQKTAQAARASSKAVATGVKAAAKATVAAVKAIIAGTKTLISAIVAGGWVAVVIIIVICLIAMIVGSCFGIFFSGESSSGPTMQAVVQELHAEYTASLDEIKAQNPHDVLEISGEQIDWPEVLAVYAVKTNSTQEVATMDDNKKAILNSVFWDTNTISYRTESREITEIIVTVDGEGNLVETSHTVTKTFLFITVSHKSADELAAQYGFSESQKQLVELLLPGNESMWSAVLTGTASATELRDAPAL